MVDELLRDVRFAVRNLAKAPGFTAIAILSLALGIMATTAMYSVIHAVVLDPFPYKDVDNLMSVRVRDQARPGGRTGYTVDQFLEIAERATIFEGVIASTISDVLWVGRGEPQRLRGNHGTFNTFQIMGVPPLLGRTPTSDDARPEAAPVVVLGHRFWQRQFGGDRGVLGRELHLNGRIHTVIGVMPKRFMWRGADVYLPVVFERGRVLDGVRFVHLLGRLKPGVTAGRAEADLAPIIADLKRKEPDQFPERWRVELLSFKETFPSSIRDDLWILFGAVGLLLLIACGNVSNLLLSRAASRQKEMAVRAAIGASRGRLVRQLLAESLVLALVSAVVGIALAYGSLQGILSLVPANTIPDESEIAINMPVLLFTLAISILTTVVFGLAPALHTIGRNLANPLRAAGRGLAGSAKQVLLRKSLVIGELALSLMLLVASSLMIRTLLAMRDVDLGFRADRLLTMRVPLPEQQYPTAERRNAFFQELLRRVSTVPGVMAAGLNTGAHPFSNFRLPVDVAASATRNTQPVAIHQINADYTRAFGIALLQGRLFTEPEVNGRQQVALVNQTFARTRLAGRPPLGEVVRIPALKQNPFMVENDSFQIVGVVNDTLNRSLTNEILPEIYLPFTILGRADRLVVLTPGSASALTGAVRNQVYALDRNQPVTDVRTIESALEEFVYAGPRFNLVLFSVFAALGLTLAVIGVYGLMSNVVSQQTREIGIRMALGADRGVILGMVIKRGATLLLAGVAAGLLASFAATRLLAQQIWNVSPLDPISFGLVSVVLFAAGLQACVWPARRAARVQPTVALRAE